MRPGVLRGKDFRIALPEYPAFQQVRIASTSDGLIIRRSWVRAPPAPLELSRKRMPLTCGRSRVRASHRICAQVKADSASASWRGRRPHSAMLAWTFKVTGSELAQKCQEGGAEGQLANQFARVRRYASFTHSAHAGHHPAGNRATATAESSRARFTGSGEVPTS